MKRRSLVALWCVLVAGALMSAQTRNSSEDRISGKWGRDGVVFLELTFDGQSAVSGTAIWRSGPGDEGQRAAIKTGTFDPKSGALKLQGEAKNPDDGAPATYVIEGKLDAGTLAGTFQFGTRTGEFSFTKQAD